MHVMERTFASHDGVELFYRAWLPDAPPRGAVLLFHRGHEHSARWQSTVESLRLDGFAFFAWDQRGHGRSPGERGSAKDLATIVKDADVFARHLCAEYGIAMENVAIIAHSVGAVIAAAWVHDYAPRIGAMVLATPAFSVKLYIPLAAPALRLKQKALGPGNVLSYVKPALLTHDPAEARAYAQDPLIFRQIAVNILLDLKDTSDRLVADASAITTPTLILAAGRDWIVNLDAQREFFRRLGSRVGQFEVLPGFYHAIFHERDRQVVVDKVRAFILDNLTPSRRDSELLGADRGGFTRTEYDLLRSPAGLRWAVVRRLLKLGGRFSAGIGLGMRTGFDSGATLDYVYRNEPRGLGPPGRLIDWFYLNSIGWRGIRVRRANLEQMLRKCIAHMHAARRPVHILDIAAGAGRYVLEAMAAMGTIECSAVLRDYRRENLDAASALAVKLGLHGVVVEQGDAFDRDSLASIAPKPTLVIVSGLYELTPDNDRVRDSLSGLADAIEPDGLLMYTNQPWHPQLEFIARALTNHHGQPWIMRRRTQAEMDELVRAAGFEKLAQEIDPWGIFTVSLARRVGA